jgi:hypothetical protein
MAIGGFIAQASSAIRQAGEEKLRRRAAYGGIVGLLVGSVVVVLSVTLRI